MNRNKLMAVAAIGAVLAIGAPTTATAQGKGEPKAPQVVGKTVGKEPDMSKPVQVFILLGQSNMVGMGRIPGGEGGLAHAITEKNCILIFSMTKGSGHHAPTSAMCASCLEKKEKACKSSTTS